MHKQAIIAALEKVLTNLKARESESLKGKLSKLVAGEQLPNVDDEVIEEKLPVEELMEEDPHKDIANVMGDEPPPEEGVSLDEMPSEDETAPPRAKFKRREMPRSVSAEIAVVKAAPMKKRGRPRKMA